MSTYSMFFFCLEIGNLVLFGGKSALSGAMELWMPKQDCLCSLICTV